MASQLSKSGYALFEQIKKVDDSGHEFWTARDMAKALEYSEYRHLLPVIDKTKEACKNSGQRAEDHLFMGYFNRSSHRASSLLSHSFAREVSWMEASTLALFFAAARGLTFTNLFACNNLRNALPSGLRSLMVRMYSAIFQQSCFIDARSNLHDLNEKSKMILNYPA